MVLPQLPSMQELQAFEAAARHLSFLHAAQELNVTAGAVSRRLASLELHLGGTLFERHHRRVELTQRGREYLAEISDALARIGAATVHAQAQPAAQHNVISICIYPTLAFRWLIPRWGRFYDQHPELDVRLTTSLSPVDFDRDGYDLAIQVANDKVRSEAGSALVYEKIMDVVLFPVCSPQLAAELKEPADLGRQTLLHGDPRPDDWPRWLQFAERAGPQFAGITRGLAGGLAGGFDSAAGPRFGSSNLAIQAAIEGLGVAIGTEVLIRNELAQGLLVQPFDLVRHSGSPFCMVYPRSKMNWPQFALFRDWLAGEAAA